VIIPKAGQKIKRAAKSFAKSAFCRFFFLKEVEIAREMV